MAQQLSFDLPARPALGRDAFFVADSNALAVAAIDGWRDWAGGKLVLVGPAGSGKTHLSHVWAADTGANRIELYTGPYGGTYDDEKAAADEIEKLGATADAAHRLGLKVNAGHDLTVENLPALVKRIPDLAEVSIGHGFTADALEFGFEATTKRFLSAC